MWVSCVSNSFVSIWSDISAMFYWRVTYLGDSVRFWLETLCLPAEIYANLRSDSLFPLFGMTLGVVMTDVIGVVSCANVCACGNKLDVVLGTLTLGTLALFVYVAFVNTRRFVYITVLAYGNYTSSFSIFIYCSSSLSSKLSTYSIEWTTFRLDTFLVFVDDTSLDGFAKTVVFASLTTIVSCKIWLESSIVHSGIPWSTEWVGLSMSTERSMYIFYVSNDTSSFKW